MKKDQGPERRKFLRHPMCFPLRYKVLKKGAKESKSSTINVGRGGLMFSAKDPSDVGTIILLKIPFENKVFKARARVVHCELNPETNLYNIGVCFDRYNDAFKVKLVEQMYLISEYRDLRSLQLGREMSLQDASREWIARYSKRFERLYW